MHIKQKLETILLQEMKLTIDPALLTEDRSIQSLGLDSMVLVQLVYLLEDDYNVTLTTSEILGVTTYGDLLALIEPKLQSDTAESA